MMLFLQHAINGISHGAVYALIAVGITLVYGLSRIIHFAVGELVMVGAFVAWETVRLTGSFTLAFGAAIVALAAVGLLTERGLFRFTLSAPLTGFIVSLGLIMVLQGLGIEIWGGDPQSMRPPFEGSWEFGDVVVRKQMAINVGVSLVVLIACHAVLILTRFGKAVRAVADDTAAAALMGIPVKLVIMATFVAGAALAGIGGWVVLTNGSISPFIGESYLLRGFAVALIGGLGNVQGAAAAGIGMGVAEALAAGYAAPGWEDAYVFGIVIAILLWRPTGLARGSTGAHI